MASFKWAVLCALVVVQACVCGAGMWPVQAAPVWDCWGGTQTQREREQSRLSSEVHNKYWFSFKVFQRD